MGQVIIKGQLSTDFGSGFHGLVSPWRQVILSIRTRNPLTASLLNYLTGALALQRELEEPSYRPGAYHSFYIHEPKRRVISAAPFRDRVVHHALCRVTVSHFERLFDPDSYANRARMGTHKALDRCQQLARRYRYVLPCDVVQFFPSIDHAVLRQTLARMLPDESVFWLIDRILESGLAVRGPNGARAERRPVFPYPAPRVSGRATCRSSEQRRTRRRGKSALLT